MRINSEEALADEKPDARAVIKAFGSSRPESLDGAILLAKAELAVGNSKAANAAIAPFWRNQVISDADEKRVLGEAARALTRQDHRVRMAMLFYRERVSDGLGMARLAGETSLAKAWAAVIRNDPKAPARLKAVPAAQRKEPAYLFARLKYYRRAGEYEKAASLMLHAPKDAAALIDPDEWWVERRIMSRALIDKGDARTAYKLAAEHAAEIACREGRGGIPCRLVRLAVPERPATCGETFRADPENILDTDQPGARPLLARPGAHRRRRRRNSYQRSRAQYGGTYYGQLAAQALGVTQAVGQPVPNPMPPRATGLRQTSSSARSRRWKMPATTGAPTSSIASLPGGWTIRTNWRCWPGGPNTAATTRWRCRSARSPMCADSRSTPFPGRSAPFPDKAKIGDTGRALAYAVARQESAFNVAAVSPANAKGLLQLLPATAKLMAKKIGHQIFKPAAHHRPGLQCDARLGLSFRAARQFRQFLHPDIRRLQCRTGDR